MYSPGLFSPELLLMYNHWIKRKTHTWTRQNPVTKSQCPIGSNVWYTFILRLITACTYILVKSLSFSIKIYFQDPHGESKASLIRKKKIPPHTPAGCKRSDSGTSQTLRLNFFGLGETNIKALLTLGIQSYLLMFENERMSPEKGPFQKDSNQHFSVDMLVFSVAQVNSGGQNTFQQVFGCVG